MASIESVRASIDANVKTNGQQKITGSVLNSVLNDMVDLSEQTEGKVIEQGGVLSELVPNVETQGETLTEQGKQIATLSTGLTEQGKNIENLDKAKADQDGKYPSFTAGFANNLVGRGEAVEATINFRPSGGNSIEDGAARVKELKGNSLVWNQWFGKDTPSFTTAGLSGTYSNGVWTYSGVVSSSSIALLPRQGWGSVVNGHKYVMLAEGTHNFPTLDVTIYSSPTSQYPVNSIFAANADCDDVEPVARNLSSGQSYSARLSLLLVDLTKMFGAGNEPTTIEEFYSRIPQNVDLYAYNEGGIVSTNAEGIKSVGFNAWDEEWRNGYYNSGGVFVAATNQICSKNMIPIIGGQSYYYANHGAGRADASFYFYDKNKEFIEKKDFAESIVAPLNAEYMTFNVGSYYGATYNHNICINLSHTGYRNGEYQPYMQFIRDLDTRIREAFPNGMRSAGNASDKVYNKNGKGYIEKRIGVVDLGSLNWAYIAPVMGASVPGVFRPTTYAERIDGLLCENYVVDTKIALDNSATDKSIKREGGSVYIKDSAYTDAATFKAAMSGVMLYYELAEPEILEFDEPFNLDYEVWDFGTEQMLSSQPSAPIKADIVYGFNAVDLVRNAQIEIAELKTQIAQMQTVMASMAVQPAMIDMPTGNV